MPRGEDTMEIVETRDLGDAGLAYVREHLSDTNVFCAALLQAVIVEPGEVFTLAPHGTPEERLRQFDRGGLLLENMEGAGAVSLPDGSTLVPVISLIGQQTKLLHEAMAVAPGAICIVDDFNPRWSDQTSSLGPTAFGVGEEVYHLITTDHDEEDIVEVVSNGNTIWHGVAAVCRVSLTLDRSRASSLSELEQCAASALLITCTAYDGEGFVAWRRTSV
jgi:hypothetical protein